MCLSTSSSGRRLLSCGHTHTFGFSLPSHQTNGDSGPRSTASPDPLGKGGSVPFEDEGEARLAREVVRADLIRVAPADPLVTGKEAL